MSGGFVLAAPWVDSLLPQSFARMRPPFRRGGRVEQVPRTQLASAFPGFARLRRGAARWVFSYASLPTVHSGADGLPRPQSRIQDSGEFSRQVSPYSALVPKKFVGISIPVGLDLPRFVAPVPASHTPSLRSKRHGLAGAQARCQPVVSCAHGPLPMPTPSICNNIRSICVLV